MPRNLQAFRLRPQTSNLLLVNLVLREWSSWGKLVYIQLQRAQLGKQELLPLPLWLFLNHQVYLWHKQGKRHTITPRRHRPRSPHRQTCSQIQQNAPPPPSPSPPPLEGASGESLKGTKGTPKSPTENVAAVEEADPFAFLAKQALSSAASKKKEVKPPFTNGASQQAAPAASLPVASTTSGLKLKI